MSTKELGEHFDIHGGGLDLKFPHHENEIAQTCGATGGKFAEIWMHNGFLNIDNEKMSKSLGNFFTTREVLAKIKHPEVLRFFLLSSHYRGPMNYSPDQLDAGRGRAEPPVHGAARRAGGGRRAVFAHTGRAKDFDAAMDDDFNTPKAIAALQGLARELNTARAPGGDSHQAKLLAGELRALGARARHPARARRSNGSVRVQPPDGLSRCRHRGAHRGADRRPQGEELGRIRPHPRRAGRGRRHPRGQAGRRHHLAARVSGRLAAT